MRREHVVGRAYRWAVVFCAFFLSGCAGHRGDLGSPAHQALPHTQAAMREASFWTRRIPQADVPVMTAGEIRLFNRKAVRELRLNYDILGVAATMAGADIAAMLDGTRSGLSEKKLVFSDGRPFTGDEAVFASIAPAADTATVRYGVVTRFADERVLPTSMGLYAVPVNAAFDELQNSGLEIGTPLAVLAATRDGAWLYAMNPLTKGWVRSDAVAFCGKDELTRFMTGPDPVVVTAPRAPFYRDTQARVAAGTLRMGTRLPKASVTQEGFFAVTIPVRDGHGNARWDTGYIGHEDAHEGHLPYTPRTIISRACAFLDTPYGWGDTGGDPDCSRLLQDIFATAGIDLPRNSSGQDEVGVAVAGVGAAVPGITILKLPGHVMLYLGTIDGRAYVIHALYGYREPGTDRLREVNRVVISDLSLGAGSKKGSLAERITDVRIIESGT